MIFGCKEHKDLFFDFVTRQLEIVLSSEVLLFSYFFIDYTYDYLAPNSETFKEKCLRDKILFRGSYGINVFYFLSDLANLNETENFA